MIWERGRILQVFIVKPSINEIFQLQDIISKYVTELQCLKLYFLKSFLNLKAIRQ